jgi:hypothetical protein
LVRYIHLNPLRAKLVNGIGALDKYPYILLRHEACFVIGLLGNWV